MVIEWPAAPAAAWRVPPLVLNGATRLAALQDALARRGTIHRLKAELRAEVFKAIAEPDVRSARPAAASPTGSTPQPQQPTPPRRAPPAASCRASRGRRPARRLF